MHDSSPRTPRQESPLAQAAITGLSHVSPLTPEAPLRGHANQIQGALPRHPRATGSRGEAGIKVRPAKSAALLNNLIARAMMTIDVQMMSVLSTAVSPSKRAEVHLTIGLLLGERMALKLYVSQPENDPVFHEALVAATERATAVASDVLAGKRRKRARLATFIREKLSELSWLSKTSYSREKLQLKVLRQALEVPETSISEAQESQLSLELSVLGSRVLNLLRDLTPRHSFTWLDECLESFRPRA